MKHDPQHLRRGILVTLVAAFVHGNAIAEEFQPQQSMPSADESRLPAITVTAPAISDVPHQNSTSIDTDTLRSLRPATSDSASLLKEIPGLDLQGAGGISSLPVVHGMADDRNRIKVDGMDLISACGNHMNPPLSYIDPTKIGRATVFASIIPVSLGGDSIGSTIQVESPATVFAQEDDGVLHNGEIGGFYRSNGNARGGNLSATLASESVSLNYTGSTASSDDYKTATDFKTQTYVNDVGDGSLGGDVVGSTMYKSTNQSLALGLRNDSHLVELKLGMQDIPYQGYPNQRMDMTGNDSTQANLRYKGQYAWGEFETRVYQEHTRHKMQFFDDKLFWYGSSAATDGIPCTPSGGPTGCAAGMPMDTEGYNTGALIKGELNLSANDLLRVGSEAQQYRLDDWWDPSGKGMWPNTFWNIRDGERDRLALFGEWESQRGTHWMTQFGLRYERVMMDAGEVQGYNTTSNDYLAESTAFNTADREKNDNNIDLTALARFTPNEQRTIEFGYARKTRSPNLYERYSWSTGGMAMRMINMTGDGNGYVGNLALIPEIAHTISATFDWHDAFQKEWGVKVTPYYTHVTDYIDAERCGTINCLSTGSNPLNLTATEGFVYLKFVNQSARLYGMDISGHYPLAKESTYGTISATGKASYMHGENRSSDDNLYNMMPLNARLALKQHKGNWTNILEAELVDAKGNVSQTRNELETAGYGLLHLRSSYEWKQARFDVGIENLLDRFYNHPLGGAYLGEGKTMSGTAVAWGTPVPGMGRSLYAGVNLKF